MATWVGLRKVTSAGTCRSLLPWLAIALVGIGVGFNKWNPTPVPLEQLDPTFMKAVTASVSQYDVKAILADHGTSGPVRLQLYTDCDEERRCTIFTTLDFLSEAHPDATTTSLRVAVRVMPERAGTRGIEASWWEVRAIDPAINASNTYAGNFNDSKHFASIGDNTATANLLLSMQSAISAALRAHGVIATPKSVPIESAVEDIPNLHRENAGRHAKTHSSIDLARYLHLNEASTRGDVAASNGKSTALAASRLLVCH